MSWLTNSLTTSIGKKVLMALTGLFLCTFLIVHLIGNLQLFRADGGYAFNNYAVFMTTNPLIKTVSWGLYATILFHAFWGLYLEFKNRSARSSRYAVVRNQSSWASRNMAILGTILLVYIAVHMGDFWYDYKFGHVPYKQYVENIQTGQLVHQQAMPADYKQDVKKLEATDLQSGSHLVVVKDLYAEVAEAFKQPLLSLFYVLAMVALAYHLIHGFQSAFRTMGWVHPKYMPFIKAIGIGVFGILIPLAYAAMPIYFLIK